MCVGGRGGGVGRGLFLKTNIILWRCMGQLYEALHGGGWVAKTSKKSVTYFMGGPIYATPANYSSIYFIVHSLCINVVLSVNLVINVQAGELR